MLERLDETGALGFIIPTGSRLQKARLTQCFVSTVQAPSTHYNVNFGRERVVLRKGYGVKGLKM